MASDDPLETLCHHFGIQTTYTDIWGNQHSVPQESLHAFLVATDLVTDEEGSIDEALRKAPSQPWRQRLDPVQVVRQSERPIPILLRLKQCPSFTKVLWRLIQESGEESRGEIQTEDLELVEQTDVDGEIYKAFRILIDISLPPGYHFFEVSIRDIQYNQSLIVTPGSCYLPKRLQAGSPTWGVSLQLYAVRSERNWGIGDFTDLGRVIEYFSLLGAGIIGVNPLHALFSTHPEQASPYSPSNRLLLNTLYIDVEQVDEFAACREARRIVNSGEFQRDLQKLRQSELVDYPAVASVKRKVLELLYKYFRQHHLGGETERGKAFRCYQADRGESLRLAALFEALQEYFHEKDKTTWGWPVWPEPFQDPNSSEVAQFLMAQTEKVEFFEYLQWQAGLQFGRVIDQAKQNSLALYCDLAVSADRAGSEVWSHPDVYAQTVSIGAPPDDFNLLGQNWGLPPYIPHRLFEARYEPFITLLRNTMPEQGALRIDHVMGLMRLFWIPNGQTAQSGAYVHYPFMDLLGILALESHRRRCLIVGEDLGTVPDEVRYALGPANVFSYRVLYFERRENGDFKLPSDYPEKAVATVGTHDLPTLQGYFQCRDISERSELGLFPTLQQREEQITKRMDDRLRLVSALKEAGLLQEDISETQRSCEPISDALAEAVVKYIAKSSARIAILQLEDIFSETDQVNLPGTVDARPNWRRKLSIPLEKFADQDGAQRMCAALQSGRETDHF